MASSKNKELDQYHERRNVDETPEPGGGNRDDGREEIHGPVFVIQEHDASTHHFDFRLEVDGVLKSWAVPKGPSTDPSEKRLAVETEDHPLEYADFEGVIPEGEYGAGTVIVWDRGRYRNTTRDESGEKIPLAKALKKGKVEVRLDGKKVRGGYALIHNKFGGDDRNWLLIKMKDDDADARRNPVNTEPESVLSGLTLEEIENQKKD